MGARTRFKESGKGVPQMLKKEPERKSGPAKREEQMGDDVCYGCGQQGHRKRDPECPKNTSSKKAAAQMYAAREILEEDSAKGQNKSDDKLSNDGEESEPSKEDPYYGSQYTSEGEEVEVDDFEQQEWSKEDHSMERLHVMRTMDIDEIALMEFNGEDTTSSDEEFLLLVEADNEEIEEETEEVIFVKEAFRALNADKGKPLQSSLRNGKYMLIKLRKSSKVLERPIWMKEEMRTFTVMVKMARRLSRYWTQDVQQMQCPWN
jgi:hypothetical protein